MSNRGYNPTSFYICVCPYGIDHRCIRRWHASCRRTRDVGKTQGFSPTVPPDRVTPVAYGCDKVSEWAILLEAV